ncbi:MAG: GNAT family N-acetyltransferase [Lachnospiraceae bacterium]|nr:GNAT family N-acetyltransferase [Lachnospiraceae bacterium]
MTSKGICPVSQKQQDKRESAGSRGEQPAPFGICFCVEDPDRKGCTELIERAAENLAADGVPVQHRTPSAARPQDHPECLYLAEDPKVAQRLVSLGGKTAGFLHDSNRGETFTGLKYVFDEPDEVDADSYRKAWERLSGIPWTILVTERLIVRETTVDDVDAFYEIYRDPSMTEFQEGLFADPEDEKRYTKDYIEKIYGLLGFGVWTLKRRADGRVIGRAGFSIRKGFEDVELGFMIGKAWQGQGYAREACEAILNFGRDILQFPRVQALVKAENEVSIRLCEKLGFTRAEQVTIEEDIYGGKYPTDGQVTFSPERYGEYIRYVIEYGEGG